MSKRRVWALLVLGACSSEGEHASASDQQKSIEVAERCSTLALQDCAADAECATLTGMAVDTEHLCLQSAEPIVCTAKDLGCDTALTIVEVAGKRYRMSSICDTPGVDIVDATSSAGTDESRQVAWAECPAQQQDSTARCAALGLEGCASDAACTTLAAEPVDVEHQCLQPAVPVVCTKKHLACTASLVIVEVAGKRYRMGGECRAPGIELVEDSSFAGTNEIKQLAWPPCAAR